MGFLMIILYRYMIYFNHIHPHDAILSPSHSHQSSFYPQLAPLSCLHVCGSLAFIKAVNRSRVRVSL